MSVRNTVKSIQDIMRQDSGVDGDAQRISQLCWMFFLKIIDDQDQQLELMQEDYSSPIPKELQWRTWATNPEGITGDELLTFVNGELFPKLKGLSVVGDKSDRRRVVRDVFEDAYNYMKSGQLMRQVINKITDVDFNNLAERQHFGDIYEQILNDLQSAGNAGEYYTPRAVTAFMAERIDPRPGEILLDPACGTGGFLTCAIRHMRDRYVKTVDEEESMQQGLRAVEKKQLPHMLCVTNMLLHGIENPGFVRHDNTLARPYISYTQSDRVDIVLTNPPFGGREEDGIESNFPKHFQTRETADLFLALIIRILKPGGRAAVVLPDGSLFGEGVKTRLKEHLMEECNLHTIVRLPNSVFKPYANIGTNLLFFEKGEPTKEIWYYEHRIPEGQKAYSMTKPIRIEHLQSCADWWGGSERKGRVETQFAWRVSAEDVKARGYNLDIKNPRTIERDHGNPVDLLASLNESEHQAATLRDELKVILAEALEPAEPLLKEIRSTKGLPNVAWNSDLLVAHFDRISSAPDAIPRLRGFIRDLAVRGKLVKQNPSEEPASELLRRIQADKEERIALGTLRKEKPIRAVADDEAPFVLPESWMWARIGTCALLTEYGTSVRSDEQLDGVPVLAMGNIQDGNVILHSRKNVSHQIEDLPQLLLKRFDILYNRTNSAELVGKTGIYLGEDDAFTFASYLIRIRFNGHLMDPRYVNLAMNASYFRETQIVPELRQQCGQANVNGTKLRNMLIPIPPIAEQTSIVARVEELMALCNGLETRLSATQKQNGALLESVLHHALLNAGSISMVSASS